MTLPAWFLVLAAEAKRVARERGVSYVDADPYEAAELHAEAERRLGAAFARLVAKARRGGPP